MAAPPDAFRRNVLYRDPLPLTPIAGPSAPASSFTAPPCAPRTPAKQRRTVHAGLCRGLPSRKRPSAELSQFSALQLDEKSAPTAAVLFPSDPLSPRGDATAPGGGRLQLAGPFLPASPDAFEYSQADTEYSNFFNRRILTDYREIGELGRGSFGRVTLYETGSGALVAVKASPPLRSAEDRQRCARERAIMSAARGFPHVAQLLDAWEEGRVPQAYLQIEYCHGGSVADAAEARRRRGEMWDEREVLIFLAHMALALDALHAASIAHVDFKPDNVLIDEAGGYRLSDFGCSVFLSDEGRPRAALHSNTNTNTNGNTNGNGNTNTNGLNSERVGDVPLFGMPAQLSIASVEEGDCRYLCSDMLNQKRYLTAGDMFSFGISLFELMSGEPLPHHGAAFLELRRRPPGEALARRGYSAPLVALVVALMQDDPAARPTAREVMRFVQLPPFAPQRIAEWTAVEYYNNQYKNNNNNNNNNNSNNDDNNNNTAIDTGALLDVRVMLASLEVTTRLLDMTRRAMDKAVQQSSPLRGVGNATINTNTNLNANVASALRRARLGGIDDSCTPKTPIYQRWSEC